MPLRNSMDAKPSCYHFLNFLTQPHFLDLWQQRPCWKLRTCSLSWKLPQRLAVGWFLWVALAAMLHSCSNVNVKYPLEYALCKDRTTSSFHFGLTGKLSASVSHYCCLKNKVVLPKSTTASQLALEPNILIHRPILAVYRYSGIGIYNGR